MQALAREIIAMRTGPIGSAMTSAMDCASGASPSRRARVERETRRALLAHLDFLVPDVCPAWRVAELLPSERTLVQLNIPVLFISGTLDGRTPMSNAEEVWKGFSNGSHVLIDGAGHGNDLFVSSPEIEKVMVKYMKIGAIVTGRVQLAPPKFQ